MPSTWITTRRRRCYRKWWMRCCPTCANTSAIPPVGICMRCARTRAGGQSPRLRRRRSDFYVRRHRGERPGHSGNRRSSASTFARRDVGHQAPSNDASVRLGTVCWPLMRQPRMTALGRRRKSAVARAWSRSAPAGWSISTGKEDQLSRLPHGARSMPTMSVLCGAKAETDRNLGLPVSAFWEKITD